MKFIQSSKKISLTLQSANRLLRTMVNYVQYWTNQFSDNLPSFPESINNMHGFVCDPTWISKYQRIVVPLKAPGELY